MSRHRYRQRLRPQRFWARLPIALLATLLTGPIATAGADGMPIPCEDIDSVGMAKMSADGTIALRIRSLWYQPIAERRFAYAPGDPQYDAIKRHLGGNHAGPIKNRCRRYAE